MLEKCKLALRITTDAYDDEISRLITAGCDDLGFADVDVVEFELSPSAEMAVITYVRMMFGSPDDFERMKTAYEIQKGQLQIRAHGQSYRC